MGDVSINGWPVLDDGDSRLATGTVPGTSRQITGNKVALPVFLHFAAAWNQLMPDRLKISNPANECDSWEVRQARAAAAFSNHASGTAIDLSYRILLADNQRHMTDEERSILRRILSWYVTSDGHHILANGYAWGKCDEMHTELSSGWETDQGAIRTTTPDDVIQVIAKMGIRPDGTAGKPQPTIPPYALTVRSVQPGQSNAAVKTVQKALNAVGVKVVADGQFGANTQTAYRVYQSTILKWPAAACLGVPSKASLLGLANRTHLFTVVG